MDNATIERRAVTRRGVLDAAGRLFYRDGIRATGMDAVAADARVSVRTLYLHFTNKDALVEAYLNDQQLPLVLRGDVTTRQEARSALLAVFRDPRTEPPFAGCPLLKASAEFPDTDSAVHRNVAHRKRSFARRLGELARTAGNPDPTALGNELALLYDGAAVRSGALGSTTPFRTARAIARTLIDSAPAED